jgi:hypothetical protein
MQIQAGKVYCSDSEIFLVLSVVEQKIQLKILFTVYKVIFSDGTIHLYYDYSTLILRAKNV